MIDKQEFQEWEQSPVTREIKKIMEDYRTGLSMALATGVAMDKPMLYARIVGRADAITEFLNNTFEQWTGGKNEDRVQH